VSHNDAGLIPGQHLDRVRAFRPKNKSCAAERIKVLRLPHDKRQTVDPDPEILRARGHIDAQPAGWKDHGDTTGIARIVPVNCASSISAETRSVMPSSTGSILYDFVLALRF
jgi:hypothetical protein